MDEKNNINRQLNDTIVIGNIVMTNKIYHNMSKMVLYGFDIIRFLKMYML